MPGARCNVASCNNSYQNTKGQGIMFHHFPKDTSIRKLWISKCRRKGPWNPNSCTICCQHFAEEDYVRDLKAELLGIPALRRLKKTAVPSQKLGIILKNEKLKCSSRGKKIKKRRQNKTASKTVEEIKLEISDADKFQCQDENTESELNISTIKEPKCEQNSIVSEMAETIKIEIEYVDTDQFQHQNENTESELDTSGIENTQFSSPDSRIEKHEQNRTASDIVEDINIESSDKDQFKHQDENTESDILQKKYLSLLEENNRQKNAIYQYVREKKRSLAKIKFLDKQLAYHKKRCKLLQKRNK